MSHLTPSLSGRARKRINEVNPRFRAPLETLVGLNGPKEIEMQDAGLVEELKFYERAWETTDDPRNKEAKWQTLVVATECLPGHPDGYDGPCFCVDCKPDWADA